MRWFNQHEGKFRLGVFLLSATPGAQLFYQYENALLGINPFADLIERSGFWAVFFMLLTLSITPLRRWLTWFSKLTKRKYGKRLSDWNYLIKSRRQIGLWCFAYASTHLVIYLHFELDWWLEDFWLDVTERYFISFGIITWLALVSLSLTSPDRVRRALGKNWRRLHRLMYVLSITGVLHIALEAKPNESTHYWYVMLTAVLLGHRIIASQITRFKRKEDTGMPSYR